MWTIYQKEGIVVKSFKKGKRHTKKRDEITDSVGINNYRVGTGNAR